MPVRFAASQEGHQLAVPIAPWVDHIATGVNRCDKFGRHGGAGVPSGVRCMPLPRWICRHCQPHFNATKENSLQRLWIKRW